MKKSGENYQKKKEKDKEKEKERWKEEVLAAQVSDGPGLAVKRVYGFMPIAMRAALNNKGEGVKRQKAWLGCWVWV